MKKNIIILLVITMASFSVYAQTSVTGSPSEGQVNESMAVITFNKLVHDYGTITKDADGNCEFTFTNTGKEPLILSKVNTTCGCTVPEWPKEPILPGKTGTIKVNYTKTNIIGNISKQVTVISNAKNGNIVLSLKGVVVEK
ncbi:MAG TPA: DUF1573 domain-containing protein [Bacteroidales bacterium]|nr:DUF1573 domain-containing protein [Bacteroidales bacterium]